jgi:1,4-alpha-glucan branching enzyme
MTAKRANKHLAPDAEALARLAAGVHHDPHSILGAHEYGRQTVIRTLRPHAVDVAALIGGQRYPMAHIDSGVFAVSLPFTDLADYRLEVSYPGTGEPSIHTVADGYRFLPTLGEVDLHLFAEGRHERLWEILGAHPRTFTTPDGTVEGVSFAVWAPNAKGVSLIGEFNGWDGHDAPMRVLGSSGVWELFWPGFATDGLYKFRVYGVDGSITDRADPMAFATEVPPHTASKVFVSDYVWNDATWMTQRAAVNPVFEPMSTYEVHLGSWRPGLTYRELAEQLTEYVVAQGFTHVELLPVTEHPFGGSWGYQVTSYYAPTSRFGSPDDFRFLVDQLHRAGIGVIVDWVPAHFPKDSWALGRFDGTTVPSGGLDYRVSTEGATLVAEMPDPDVLMYVVQGGRKLPLEKIPRVKRPVVMATGSHNYQTYWVTSPRYPGLLQTLPLVFLPETSQWIPREQAFMRAPDDKERFVTQWNHHCIRCHSGLLASGDISAQCSRAPRKPALPQQPRWNGP